MRTRGISSALIVLACSAFAGPKHASINIKRSKNGGAQVVPSAGTLCSQLTASNKSGNWWCLQGDGTMLAGSAVTLTSVNSPQVVGHPVCPSGSNCTDESDMRLNPVNGAAKQYFQVSTAPPTGSFTTCALGSYDQTNKASGSGPLTTWIYYGDLTGGANLAWQLYTGAGAGTFGVTLDCVGPLGANCASVLQSNVQVYVRNVQFNCGVFEAGVRSRACTYVESTNTMTCVDLTHVVSQVNQTSRKWAVGIDDGIANGWQGFMRGVFMTEKALTTTEMTTIARAAIVGVPSGVTFSRSTKTSCCRLTDGQCTDISDGVPCIIGGTAVVQAAAGRNYLPASERLDPAAGTWTLDGFNGSTASTNAAIGPYGLQMADQINFAANLGANEYERLYNGFSVGGSNNTVTCSVATKSVAGGSGNIDICIAHGATVSCGVCAYTGVWSRCHYTLTGVAASGSVFLGNLSFWNGGTQRSAINLYMTHAQCELSATETAYINTGTTVTTNATRGIETCSGKFCP